MQDSKRAVKTDAMEMEEAPLCARIPTKSGSLVELTAGVKGADFPESMECTRLLKNIETG